jgi:hypothetical protein
VHQVAFLKVLIVGVDTVRVTGEGVDVAVQIRTAVLVEHREQGHELAVHVLGGAVPAGLAPGGDDDRPDQPGVGVAAPIHRGVVHPQHRGGIIGPRARPGRDPPDLPDAAARRDGVVGPGPPAGAVVVASALGGLAVEDPVGVQAHRKAGLVLEPDDDGVADLGLDDRPQQAQVLPFGGARLGVGEAGVGVLPIPGLDVDLADAVGALLDKDVLGRTERLAGDVVQPKGA